MPNMVALKTIEGDKETEAVPDKAPREAAQ
jgi:hypothetical protein